MINILKKIRLLNRALGWNEVGCIVSVVVPDARNWQGRLIKNILKTPINWRWNYKLHIIVMEQKNKLKLSSGGLLVFILTVGVFGIINTEMGVVGILPLIAETYHRLAGR